jgi:hypothetical protein
MVDFDGTPSTSRYSKSSLTAPRRITAAFLPPMRRRASSGERGDKELSAPAPLGLAP